MRVIPNASLELNLLLYLRRVKDTAIPKTRSDSIVLPKEKNLNTLK